jgi:hypothetical protein
MIRSIPSPIAEPPPVEAHDDANAEPPRESGIVRRDALVPPPLLLPPPLPELGMSEVRRMPRTSGGFGWLVLAAVLVGLIVGSVLALARKRDARIEPNPPGFFADVTVASAPRAAEML